MIIVVGPDHSGKTVLVETLSKLRQQSEHIHHDMNTTYEEYLAPLASLSWREKIIDRYIICEIPYHKVKERKFGYSMKQFHNIMLLTLMQRPVIVLSTHKPFRSDYLDTYLPYELWSDCLKGYKDWLRNNRITFYVYDYDRVYNPEVFRKFEVLENKLLDWWTPMWEEGFGAIGSPEPDILMVAERLGPNNINNLPFETGPTGYMLSESLRFTKVPLGKIAVTNIVKAARKDPRPPNRRDLELFEVELTNMKPNAIIFIGSVSLNAGSKVAKSLGIQYVHVPHYGYYHKRGVHDMTSFNAVLGDIFRRFLREDE